MKANLLTVQICVLLTLMFSASPALLAAGEIDATPPPGKAAVVVYRPAKLPGVLMQSNEPYHIGYDLQWISTVKKGEYFVFYAWPGTHRIQPAISSDRMAANDDRGSSMVNLDVKAGETYYVRATPSDTAHLLVGAEDIALALTDQESARKDLLDSTPVEWAKDLVEGTLAEVQVLGPQAGGTGAGCKPVEWTPDIDSIKTSSFKRTSILKGTVFLRGDALLLQLNAGSAATAPVGVTIPYADMASVEVRNKVLKRIVVVTRKSGRLDSFSVTTAGGGRIDRDQTKACGDELAGKLQK